MRRQAVLALLALGGLLLVLFPSVWRAVGRVTRTFLVAVAAVMVAAGTWRLSGRGSLPPLSTAESALTVLGLALLASAAILVAADRRRGTRR